MFDEMTVRLTQNVAAFRRCTLDSQRYDILREIENMHTEENFEFPIFPMRILSEMRSAYASMLKTKEALAYENLDATRILTEFYKNADYMRRINFEIANAEALLLRPVRSLLLVGCGAIPTSAIYAAQRNIAISVLDHDKTTLDRAKTLLNVLGFEAECLLSDARDLSLTRSVDLVVVAGTVGVTTAEKTEIAEKLLAKLWHETLLCFRLPVREELALMAPLGQRLERAGTLVSLESPIDYLRRIYITASS